MKTSSKSEIRKLAVLLIRNEPALIFRVPDPELLPGPGSGTYINEVPVTDTRNLRSIFVLIHV